MKVFVAGATGAVGTPLVRQLQDDGHEVSAITRSEQRAAGLRGHGVDAYVGDALDEGRLRQILKASRPEVIVHQLTTFPTTMNLVRTIRDGRQTARLRIEGARLFMAIAQQLGIRRVVAQSIAFMYRPSGTASPVDESHPHYGDGRRTMDLFMRHLVRTESIVLGAEDVEGVALRYGGWYGPGTHFAAGGLMHRLATKRRLPEFQGTRGYWNAIHVEDAAAATVAALDGPTGVFNVVDDGPLPLQDAIRTYASSIGAPPPRVLPRAATAVIGFYGRHFVFHQPAVANDKAKAELGWKPRYATFSEGMEALE